MNGFVLAGIILVSVCVGCFLAGMTYTSSREDAWMEGYWTGIHLMEMTQKGKSEHELS